MSQTPTVNFDLVDQVVEQIPDWAWDAVCQSVVPAIVDDMPSFVVERLTGKHDNFDRAEEILFDYYKSPEHKAKLIADAFSLIGTEVTINLLHALQLDKLNPNTTDEVSIM
jgi:hypothetical protein